MERLELKCSACGGNLNKIETLEDTYVCLHCGSREIIKQESAPVTNNITNNITTNVYNGVDGHQSECDKLIRAAESFIEDGKYEKAGHLLEKAKKINETDYRIWWLLVKTKLLYNIKNYSDGNYYKFERIRDDFNTACSFASKEEKSEIEKEYKLLCKKFNETNDEIIDIIPASFNPEKEYLKLIVCAIVSVLIEIIFLLLAVLNGSVWYVLILCLVAIVSSIILVKFYKERKLLKFIKGKERVDFDEITIYANDNELCNVLSYLITNNYLVGYKVERSYIIKVDESEIESEQD